MLLSVACPSSGAAPLDPQKAVCRLSLKNVQGHTTRGKVCRRVSRKPAADLSVGIEPSVERSTAGNIVTYTVLVENRGPRSASEIVLSLSFPSGTEYAYTLTPSLNCQGSSEGERAPLELKCRIKKLAPSSAGGAEAPPPLFLVFEAEPALAGSFPVAAGVHSLLSRDPHPANNHAQTVTQVAPGPPLADLSVSVHSAPDPASVGEDFTETVTVTNKGPTEAIAAKVNLLLPQGTSFADFSGIAEPAPVCAPLQFGGPWSLTLCWGVVESGQTVTATLTLEPSADTPASLETNALVSSSTPDPDLRNNRATAVADLAPFHPSPGVDLVVSLHPPTSASAGKEFALRFGVANVGAETAQDVRITLASTPPLENSYLSIYLTGEQSSPVEIECSPDGSSVDCTIPALASGTGLIGIIEGSLSKSGPLSATLTANSASADSNPSNNTTSATFQVSG